MLRYGLIVACAVSLAGCEAWKSSARINPSTVAVYEAVEAGTGATLDCPLTNGLYDSNRGSINLDCFKFPEQRRLTPQKMAYDMATVSDAEQAKIARNRLASVLIKHADDVCVVEKGRLVATESSANFILSFLATAFSGASTVVGGETAKTILSGIATQASATQDNVNATFYRNQLVQAINKSIDDERARVMTEIVSAKAQQVSAVNVDDIVRLANAYHHACSFERGLQVLLNAALDSNGANAVLESRARQAAINELKSHVAYLDRAIGATAATETTVVESLQQQRNEALAKIHGLEIAIAQQKITDPEAGDVVPIPEETEPGTGTVTEPDPTEGEP